MSSNKNKNKKRKNMNNKVVAVASAGTMLLGVASPLMNPVISKAISGAPTFSANTTAPTQESVMVSINYPSDAITKKYKIGNHTIGRASTSTGGIYVRGTAFENSQSRILEVDGKVIYDQNSGRGMRLTVLDRYTKEVIFDGTYDTYGSDQAITDLANKLNSYSTDTIAIVTSFDAIHINATLQSALNRAGGNAPIVVDQRLPYVLIGVPGMLTGNGLQRYTDSTTQAFAEITTKTDGNYGTPYGMWFDYTRPVPMSNNGAIYAKGIDSAGASSSTTSYTVSNIERTAPTASVSLSTTSPTNQNVTATVTGSDASGISRIQLPASGNGLTAKYYNLPTGTDTPTTDGTLVTTKVDPTINFDWASGSPLTGVNSDYFLVEWTGMVYAPETGAYTFESQTDDGVQLFVNNQLLIDRWQANTAIFNETVNLTGGRYYPIKMRYYERASVAKAILKWKTPSMSTSAVIPTTNLVPEGTWVSGTSASQSFASNGTYQFVVEDKAGNRTVQPVTISNIDKTAPSIPTFSQNVTGSTNQNVSVTINYPSDSSLDEYSLDNGTTWQTYTTPIVMTVNGTIKARAKDSAGNYSSVASHTVNNIDKTAPTITLTPSTTTITNTDVSISVSASDNVNGPNGIKVLKWANGSQTASYFASAGTTVTNNVFTVSGNGVYTVFAEDGAGNETVKTITISNIDKTAPANATFTQDVTSPTNGNVNVTINYPSDASVKQYKIGSTGTWTTYSAPIVVSADNTVVYARSMDSAGNTSAETSHTVTNIDKVAPTTPSISADVTAVTNGNVVLTVSYPSDATVKEYSINGGTTWVAYTTPVTMTANGTLQARAKDSAGNVSAVGSYAVSNIDKTAPNSPTLVSSTTSPTNQNVSVSISYPTDSVTDQYRINGGAWTTYSSAVVMSANGTVEARSIDQAGNISAISSLTVSNIDKTPPANASLSPSTTNPTNSDVTVSISYPIDAVTKQYKIGSTGTWMTYSTPVVVSSNNTIYARSMDAVGNVSSEVSLVIANIDKVAPTTPTLSSSNSQPTNEDVTITVSYPSDAVVKEVRVNGGTWTAYSTGIVMTANGTVEARAKDVAGNYSAIGSYSITNIDKTSPVDPTFVVSTTAPTNQNVSLTINYPSDASLKQYKLGSTGTWTTYSTPVSLSSNNTVYARAYDAVGNVSGEVSYAVTNIDKTAPNQPTIQADVTTPTNGNVVLTATYPSDASVKEYSLNGGSTWVAYTTPVTMTANGTFQARARDVAGNYSTVASYSVTNIDKTPPATATLVADQTSPTNADVKVTIGYPSDAVTKQYKVGSNGTWTSYSSPVTVSSNNTVYARSYDNAGNVSPESSLVVNNIDKTNPTANAPTVTSTLVNSDTYKVTVTGVQDGQSGVKHVAFPTWTSKSPSYTSADQDDLAPNWESNPLTIGKNLGNGVWEYTVNTANHNNEEGLYITHVYVIDNAGNKYMVGSTLVTVDRISPTLPTLTSSNESPTNQNVNVTIQYPADTHTKQYRVNNGSWTTYTTPVVVTENSTVEARAIDEAGNISNIASYSITNIDKTSPVNATFSVSNTAPTNQDVSVSISYPTDASIKQYKIGSTGTWMNYTTPVVLSSNNTVYARSYDAVGNLSSESSVVVSNIDKVAPTTPSISADVTSPTNGDVALTVTFSNDSFVKEYRINGGAWTIYSSPVKMTSNGKIEVRSKDVAGNYSAIGSYSVANIDKTAPEKATFSPSTTSPTNEDVEVTISYPSDASVKQYKVGSTGIWTSYSTPVTVTSNNTVYARSYDAVGNLSEEANLVVSNIDKTPPTQPILSASTTSPTNSNVVVSISYPVDASVKQYRVNGGSWQTYNTGIVMMENGKVEARALDVAGNVSTIGSLTVSNIDKTPPALATFTPNVTSPTNQNVSINIEFPSDASVKEYKIGSTGTWMTYTTPVIVTSNNTVFARSTDAVGNVSAESSFVVNNIDKTPPTTPILVADKTALTNVDVIVTATFPSDSVVKEVRIDGGDWTSYTSPIVMKENGKVEVRAKDVAGNYSQIGSYTVTNIDKVAPLSPSIESNVTTPTNQDVKVSISYPSDVALKQFRVGTTGEWKTYSEPVVLSENNTIYARGFDSVGNMSEEATFEVSNIDKIAPNTPTLVADKTIPTNTNVVVSAQFPIDSAKKEVRVNGGEWSTYTAPITMTENGKVEVRAIDEAGNVSTIGIYEVSNIDKVAPTIPVLVADKTNSTNTDVLVTATFASDSVKNEVRVNGGSWTAYTSPIRMTQNGKVEVRSYDNATNVSAISSYEVANIDKVAPEVATLSANTVLPTNQDVTVTATFPSDVVKKEYRINGGSWSIYTTPISMKDNGKVEVRGYDQAGNISELSSYEVKNIDKLAPENPTYVMKENANTFELKGESGSKTLYRVNNGAWTEYKESVVTNDGSYKIEMKSVDPASNESDVVTVDVSMYRDALAVAVTEVEKAEKEIVQENVNVAKEKVSILPQDAYEYEPLMKRVNDLQAVIDAQLAIEKANDTRTDEDFKLAQEKVSLLDSSNPIIINLLPDIEADLNESDILNLVAKERYDILSTKYQMSKVAYNSLVQTYYAIKYTGDSMYKMASDKLALVPIEDRHYNFVHEQFEKLSEDYGIFVQDRIQTDAEIKAEASVQVMESKYDPTLAVNTQNLINAVEDATVRTSLQQRLDTAKAKYEASLLDKASQTAITAVEKAESTKQSYYITDAYKKVNVLTDEALKSELTSRLQKLEQQIAYEKQVTDATRYVGYAEQYKTQSYIDTAQTKVSALPNGAEKTALQQRLDVVKSSIPTADQATIIKNATSYVSLAQTMKTQYYVDKAQGYVDQILDEVKKAELQAKLDAIVVK